MPTYLKAGHINVVLSRLEDHDLIHHKGNYWAPGEGDEVAASRIWSSALTPQTTVR